MVNLYYRYGKGIEGTISAFKKFKEDYGREVYSPEHVIPLLTHSFRQRTFAQVVVDMYREICQRGSGVLGSYRQALPLTRLALKFSLNASEVVATSSQFSRVCAVHRRDSHDGSSSASDQVAIE